MARIAGDRLRETIAATLREIMGNRAAGQWAERIAAAIEKVGPMTAAERMRRTRKRRRDAGGRGA